MTDDKTQPKQKTQPKGTDKRTGKPAKPIEIPVPDREDVDRLIRCSATRRPSK